MEKFLTKYRKYLSFLIVTIVILLGTFKPFIIVQFENASRYISNNIDLHILNSFILTYNSTKTINEWVAHYVFYYPLYLCCHFLLIQVLFHKEKKIIKWFTTTLLIGLLLLVLGKVIFGYLNAPILAEYFSFAFHNLIALPFLLLAIEGGRYFYKLIFFEEHN